MGYLITQIIICLLIAALIGATIGWWLKKLCCDRRFAEMEESYKLSLSNLELDRNNITASLAGSGAVALASPTNMATEEVINVQSDGDWPYPVEEVEGIGPTYGGRLRSININTTEELLLQCCEASQQTEVSKTVRVEAFVVGKWVIMSDLMRIAGIRGQYAELLEASSIASVGELARQEGSVLAARMVVVNAEEHRTPEVPNAETVTEWIEAAKGLVTMIKSLVPK